MKKSKKSSELSSRKRNNQSQKKTFITRTAAILAALVLLNTFVFGMVRMTGNSMYPSVRAGDFCLMFRLEDYHTGDVVAYSANGKTKYGRIILMSGTFNISDAEEPMLGESVITESSPYRTPKGKYELPCTLKENEVWIMNDFRSDTSDSRDFGPVRKSQLKGKVMFLFRRRSF